MKNFDFQQFLINHGEKLALGFGLLLVFVAVFTSSWVPYSGTPEEILASVEDTQKKIAEAEWPADQVKVFDASKNVREDVDRMLAPLATNEFQFKTDTINPLYLAKAPISEPEWLPVESLIADAGRTVVEIDAPKEVAAAGDKTQGALDPAKKREQEAKKQEEAQKKQEQLQSQLPLEFQRPEGREQKKKAVKAKMPAIKVRFGRRRDEEEYDPNEGLARTGQPGGTGTTIRRQVTTSGYGRGYRFVAVRGVFPLERQINQLRQALSAPQTTDLSSKIKIKDFQLQRQAAVPGPNPWSGPWEDVDVSVAKNVLSEAIDFYFDDLDPGVVDSVITMPIPQLVFGRWGPRASHPEIENFKLTDEQKQQAQLIEEKLVEEAAKKSAAAQPETIPEGGFADMQYDSRAMRQSLNADDRKRLAQSIAKETNATSTEAIDKQLVSAAGRLILFRYIDFDVDPGQVYRYRVRLKLENPNRTRLLEEVADPSVVQGATRWTEWSQPTSPVYVPPDTKYFVEEVNPPRGRSLANAQFSLYQWMPEWGTVVNSKLRVELGDFITGEAETDVLNPARGEFTKEKVKFDTDDMLVDVFDRPIDLDEHPDLKPEAAADSKSPSRSRGRIELPVQVLVVDQYGDLQSLDPVSRKEERAMTEERFRQERANFQEEFEAFVEQEKKNRLDEIAAREKKTEKASSDDDGGRRRRGNPRRRRGND